MRVIARDFESSFLRALRSPPDSGGRVMFRSHSAHLRAVASERAALLRAIAPDVGTRSASALQPIAVVGVLNAGNAREPEFCLGSPLDRRVRVRSFELRCFAAA